MTVTDFFSQVLAEDIVYSQGNVLSCELFFTIPLQVPVILDLTQKDIVTVFALEVPYYKCFQLLPSILCPT